MELLTIKELESLTGIDIPKIARLVKKFQQFFPVSMTPLMIRNELFPRGNVSFLLMLSELSLSGDYTAEQLEEICRRVSESRSRRQQMTVLKPEKTASEEIIEKLDLLLHGNHILRKDSEKIRNINLLLTEKNGEMQEILRKIARERDITEKALNEKDQIAQLQARKINQLTEALVKLKKENEQHKTSIAELEKKAAKPEPAPVIMSANSEIMENKLDELEKKHRELNERLYRMTQQQEESKETMFQKLIRWLNTPLFDNNCSF